MDKLSVDRKHIDIAMAVIIERDHKKKADSCLTRGILRNCGLPDNLDLDFLLETLASMGLIDYRYDQRLKDKAITLKDSGRRYLVDQQEKESQRRHDWLIAIVPALLGALLSEPLWMFIRWVYSLLLAKS